MANYIDNKGKKIEKGFYKYTGVIWYFTGKYSPEYPMFDNETGSDIPIISSNTTKKFNKLTKEEVEKIIKKSKSKINFLEEKLK